ncbi:MAG: PilZ domain-containing protein [Candidatus Omnitrophica bacterium]|nr:PilZ domain-containing protein [Candidatus Omnitrophota bacterium]
MENDRRKYIRHLLVSPLEYKVEDEIPFSKTHTVDMGEGGLLFTAKNDVPIGSQIEIKMPLYEKVFNIKAKVVHTAKDPEDQLFKIGVSFSSYSDAFKVKLIEQIYLIEEYRVLRSLQLGRDISLQEASEEWIKRYSERFKKLYW